MGYEIWGEYFTSFGRVGGLDGCGGEAARFAAGTFTGAGGGEGSSFRAGDAISAERDDCHSEFARGDGEGDSANFDAGGRDGAGGV